MRAIANFLLTVFLLSFSNCAFSQVNEGKATYDISFPDGDLPKEQLAMLPTEAFIWFNGQSSRMEMKMGMGMSMANVINGNDLTILMDIMGNKMAMKKDLADTKKGAGKPQVELTEETKMIAGYKCKKAIVKGKDIQSMVVWFTDQISGNNQWNEGFQGIKGFPMEFTIESNQINMHMIAKDVSLEKVDSSLFVIPSDYKLMTEDDMKSLFGGKK